VNKKLTLVESLVQIKKNSGIVNEVDWADDFGDVKKIIHTEH
jgi:hypothetical protein